MLSNWSLQCNIFDFLTLWRKYKSLLCDIVLYFMYFHDGQSNFVLSFFGLHAGAELPLIVVPVFLLSGK